MSDSENALVVDFRFVLYILDSLAKLNKRFRIEIRTNFATATRSERETERDVFHAVSSVEIFPEKLHPVSTEITLQYLSRKSQQCLRPHIEDKDYVELCDCLKSYIPPDWNEWEKWSPIEVDNLDSEPCNIPKFIKWPEGKCQTPGIF